MNRVRLVFVAAALAFVALLPSIATAAPAPPFESSGECLECHDLASGAGALSKVDFEVPGYPGPETPWDRTGPTIDKSKCNACHWKTNHYPHGSDRQCNSCHYAFPSREDFYFPLFPTPYGNFATPYSPDLTPEIVHQIHTNGSWPQQVLVNPYTSQPNVNCVSCHAPAACDACHAEPVPHGAHTGSAYPGISMNVARGVAEGDATLDTTTQETVTCVNATCHSLAIASSAAPKTSVEQNHINFVYGGLWSTGTDMYASGGTFTSSGRAGATATYNFVGSGRVEIYGRRSPAQGIVSISVDGGPATSVSAYSTATAWNSLIFATPALAEGTHTIALTVTGTREPGALSNAIVIDYVRATSIDPNARDFVPECVTCHAGDDRDPVDRTHTHGYEQVDHQGDVGTQTFGDKRCDSCHAMDVLTEHERSTSASAGRVCDTCHPTPRDSFGAWDQSCQQGGCHATSSPQEPHAAMAAGHTPAAAGAVCAECHAGDLAAVHVDKASSTDPAVTSCNLCHSTSAYPTTNDCTTCHFTFDNHYDTAKHLSPWTLENCDDAGCHSSRDLMTAHTEKNAAFTCFGCHASDKPEVVAAIEGNDASCGACHTGITQTSGHRSVHPANPPLIDASGPHYTYGVGSTGTLPTSDCAMCHASNLVDEHMGSEGNPAQQAFDGSNLDCGSCHDSANPSVQAAIAGDGQTACEKCHTVHNQIPAVHTSTYALDAESDCSLCHSNVISVVHDYDMVATLPSGRQLTGCELCHAYREGDMGLRVQTAIEVANDTKCTACHVTKHEGVATAHDFSADTGCEGAGCHDTSDAAAVHAAKPGGGCSVCHKKDTLPPSSCADAACHGTDPHPPLGPAHTATSSAGCVRCHPDGSGTTSADVRPLHAPNAADDCGICHDNAGRVGDVKAKTAECASCHATSGTDYHRAMSASHIGFTPNGTCTGAGCHPASGSLPDVHALYVGAGKQYSQYADTCALCHLNDDATRIDWSTASASCGSCHGIPHDRMQHAYAAPESQSCLGCHEAPGSGGKSFVPGLHGSDGTVGGDWAKCATCHNNPTQGDLTWNKSTSDCAGCHDYYPSSDKHYPTSAHAATDETLQPGVACSTCHALDMKAEHAKTTSGPTSCETCHESKVDAFTSPWDGSCAACHATKHDGQSAAHDFTTVAGACTGAGCHAVGDVEALHATATNGPCATCHSTTATPPRNCADAACHGTEPHGDLDLKHTAPDSSGCLGCHNHNSAIVSQIHPNGCTTCHDGSGMTDGITPKCTNCHTEQGVELHPTLNVAHTSTDSASADCARCHETTNLTVLHTTNQCATCHTGTGVCYDCHPSEWVDPPGVIVVEKLTAACASCHTTSGTDYHEAMSAKHTFTGMGTLPEGCMQAGCHANNTLPELHAPYVGTGNRYPQYSDSCALCHLNADASRIDWGTASADCRTCHSPYHPASVDAKHSAPDSQECVECHETANVYTLHADRVEGKCAVCHANPTKGNLTVGKTTKCTNCHAYSPADPRHYPTAPHAASDGTLTPGGACSTCHSMDMKAEHFKATAKTSSGGAITCVLCHEVKVDTFTSAWDKSCQACHASKHGAQNAGHDFSTTNPTCGGTGCHAIGNVTSIHSAATGGPCATCHDATSVPVKNCTASGCHEGATGDHHEDHNTTGAIDAGCKGCHYTYLDDEHTKLGYTCDTCHKSSVQAVKDAIAANRRDCDACHPAVNGKDRHAAQEAYEFSAGNSSAHRAYDTLPGMRSSFVVNGSTYTWTLPSASSFLKTGWTTSSVVTCDDCHTFSSTAAGPHGSSVTVNIDPAYPGSYKTAYLGSNGVSPSNMICAKCHTNFSNMNSVHGEGDHQNSSDGKCVNCHSPVPHGWRLPRLLAYVTDPAPYRTASGGIAKISLRSHTASNWSESDCQAACAGDHDRAPSPYWPSLQNAVGTLQGVVLDEAGLPVAGATAITDKGQAATTNFQGVYVFNDIAGGVYNVTVSKSGYITQTRTGTVTNDAVTDVDFVLATVPAPGTVTGVVTNDGGSPIAGATVSGGGTNATTDGAGRYSLTLSPGAYALTAGAEGYTSASANVTVTSGGTSAKDFVLVGVPVNVALAKPVSYSSQYSSTYGASKAVDGLTSTYWRSTSGGTQYITVDLGGYYDLTKAVVDWNGSYYARSYRIDVSMNGSAWTQVYSTTNGTSGSNTINFAAAARYVRLYCTYAYGSSYRVDELEVYGTPAAVGSVTGYVKSVSGTPVVGATVSGAGVTATTDTTGRYSLAGVLAGSYSFTAAAGGYEDAVQSVVVTGGQTSQADFTLVKALANLAVGRPVSYSSQYSSTYSASKAVDGLTSTYWRSSSGGTQYLNVDLGATYALEKVVLNWYGSYYASNYKVEVSTNGSTWTQVYSTTNGTSGIKTHSFTASARYVRLTCNTAPSGNYRLNEFEVWGR